MPPAPRLMPRAVSRLANAFANLKAAQKTGLITFITAGDPNYDDSLKLLDALPMAGADIIELGMPFTDPMADGPIIQAAGRRALTNGMTLAKLLEIIRNFRVSNQTTPLVLMGYANPVFRYGLDDFMRDAAAAGADGLIIVDVPPEERTPWVAAAKQHDLDWVGLITPTTDAARAALIAREARGFIYYVAVAGITGAGSADVVDIAAATARLRAATDLPLAVGFGIKNTAQAAALVPHADAVVVGSALVDKAHNQTQAIEFVQSLRTVLDKR